MQIISLINYHKENHRQFIINDALKSSTLKKYFIFLYKNNITSVALRGLEMDTFTLHHLQPSILISYFLKFRRKVSMNMCIPYEIIHHL